MHACMHACIHTCTCTYTCRLRTQEELSLAVLQDAGGEPQMGRKLVFEALALEGDVRLLRGERLAIAHALALQAQGDSVSVPA